MPRPPASLIRLSDPAQRRPQDIDLAPDAEARAALARDLDIPAIRKLRLQARLEPVGRTDWQLDGRLGATVVQDCVATGAPVVTRIDEPVLRRYLANLPDPGPGEVEMPEDDSTEPLPATLDLHEVLAEALALALPPFPRAADAPPVDLSATPPGAAPLDPASVAPFAGLAGLRDRLAGKDKETPDEE